jgi:hypothetical protein
MLSKNRRTVGSVAAAAATVSAAVLVGLGPNAADAADSRVTLRFVAHDVPGNFAMADIAPPNGPGPDIGDVMAFTQRLTHGGETVGRISNVAIGVDHQRHLFQSTGTASLAHGKVTFSGLVPQKPHFRLAVTGGTGRYRGVGGVMAFDNVDGRQHITLTLTR